MDRHHGWERLHGWVGPTADVAGKDRVHYFSSVNSHSGTPCGLAYGWLGRFFPGYGFGSLQVCYTGEFLFIIILGFVI
jgi:hypothetical protein